MTAVMRILGWKARGLRCPDHEISFTDSEDQPFRVSLIQMPNGTGKTTTLALLRAALSGAAIETGWDRQKVAEFQKRNSDSAKGRFEVLLLLNNRRATIVMDFDFENGRVSYRTTHSSGQIHGFNPASDFRRFMNESFVNFYVFDGELAQHLLNRQYADAGIAVENLFQLNVFSAMSQKVDEYWDSKTENVSAAKKSDRLTRYRKRLVKLKNHFEKCKRTQHKLQNKQAELAAQLRRKEEAYRQEIDKESTLSQEWQNAKTNAEQLKNVVREEALDVLDGMRDPHALSSSFAASMLALKRGLDRVKLPESAAREFFEDLARESECVCGRPINKEIAAIIRSRAARYLGTDDVALLNSMKTMITDAIGDSLDEAERNLEIRVANLATAMENERNAINDRDLLRHEAEQSDPSVRNVRETIEELEKQIKNNATALEKFDSREQTASDEQTYGIEILDRRIKNVESMVAKITHTLVEKAKRDTLRSIIYNAHKKARTGITTELCSQTNERISNLMPHNSISIGQIKESLILKGQESGSVGETLSIAYAFLATLFNQSSHQLPFVVDSPAGPIDLAVRPKIGELIPKLTEQFIAFTISSERERFIEPLKLASNTEIQFVTLFRKGSEEMERVAYEKGVVRATADGLNVTGEDFFNDFQLEEESAI